jgi:mRNA interferase HigB
VRIITESRLSTFWTEHPTAEIPLKAWRGMIRRGRFESPHEVKAQFPSVDFLRGGTTVFDIGGNKYRLVVDIRYHTQKVFIRHVLTHPEYDQRSRSGGL